MCFMNSSVWGGRPELTCITPNRMSPPLVMTMTMMETGALTLWTVAARAQMTETERALPWLLSSSRSESFSLTAFGIKRKRLNFQTAETEHDSNTKQNVPQHFILLAHIFTGEGKLDAADEQVNLGQASSFPSASCRLTTTVCLQDPRD